MDDFLEEMKRKRKVALRLGYLSDVSLEYIIKPSVLKALINNGRSISSLSRSDLELSIKQKGVDMKIGIDILGVDEPSRIIKQVDRIVLIAGDSDFVPAAKLARREGIDFILDNLRQNISSDLHEHIDGIITKLHKTWFI